MHLRTFVPVACTSLALLGCSDASVRFPVTPASQAAVSEVVDIVVITEANIAQFSKRQFEAGPTSLPRAGGGEYLVGPGDELFIHVFEHPELSIPLGESGTVASFRVRADGTFEYPFIGSVTARGRTLDQIRDDLKDRLSKFIPDPQLDVRIAEFKSQRIVVGGAVQSPNTQFVTTTPTTLLEAINSAGGLLPDADPRAIIVRRQGRNHPVDLEAFLTASVSQNNPVLVGGDVVSIPKKRTLEAYILGEVASPSTIDLSKDTVSLTQALAKQGGINEARADARGVFVFRRANGRFQVFQLDTRVPTSLVLGAAFVLEPSDVVYVTKSKLQRWNDTITRILPTVSAVSATESISQ